MKYTTMGLLLLLVVVSGCVSNNNTSAGQTTEKIVVQQPTQARKILTETECKYLEIDDNNKEIVGLFKNYGIECKDIQLRQCLNIQTELGSNYRGLTTLCIVNIAGTYKDESLCEFIPKTVNQDNYWYCKVMATGDRRYCSYFDDPKSQSKCIEKTK